jgi:D-sedoheptulose 7-phosphate isomerase
MNWNILQARSKNFMHSNVFIDAAIKVCEGLDKNNIESIAECLSGIRGRLFILGVGGSAANASHAVNDFRKLCAIEAYAPTDNVAEFTARTNDEGWPSVFAGWLLASRLNKDDVILILSVGGGTPTSSPNFHEAIKCAREKGAKVIGIVGKDNGYTAKLADIVLCIPIVNDKWITPMSEAFQMVILHALVSHPLLQKSKTRW